MGSCGTHSTRTALTLWLPLHAALTRCCRTPSRYLKRRYVLGCSKSIHEGGYEADAASGLLKNHAYGIVHLKQVGQLKFVKVRNPWGMGEWRGDWSDSWAKWDQHPDVESALLVPTSTHSLHLALPCSRAARPCSLALHHTPSGRPQLWLQP